jgi:hypothetical protein
MHHALVSQWRHVRSALSASLLPTHPCMLLASAAIIALPVLLLPAVPLQGLCGSGGAAALGATRAHQRPANPQTQDSRSTKCHTASCHNYCSLYPRCASSRHSGVAFRWVGQVQYPLEAHIRLKKALLPPVKSRSQSSRERHCSIDSSVTS